MNPTGGGRGGLSMVKSLQSWHSDHHPSSPSCTLFSSGTSSWSGIPTGMFPCAVANLSIGWSGSPLPAQQAYSFDGVLEINWFQSVLFQNPHTHAVVWIMMCFSQTNSAAALQLRTQCQQQWQRTVRLFRQSSVSTKWRTHIFNQ